MTRPADWPTAIADHVRPLTRGQAGGGDLAAATEALDNHADCDFEQGRFACDYDNRFVVPAPASRNAHLAAVLARLADHGATEVFSTGEAYYIARGWSGCAGSEWGTLSQATRDGWEAAARETRRADHGATGDGQAAVKALDEVQSMAERASRKGYDLDQDDAHVITERTRTYSPRAAVTTADDAGRDRGETDGAE